MATGVIAGGGRCGGERTDLGDHLRLVFGLADLLVELVDLVEQLLDGGGVIVADFPGLESGLLLLELRHQRGSLFDESGHVYSPFLPF